MFDITTYTGIIITIGYLLFAVILFRGGSGIANLCTLAASRSLNFEGGICAFSVLVAAMFFDFHVEKHGFTYVTMAIGQVLYLAAGFAYRLCRNEHLRSRREDSANGPVLTIEQLVSFDAARGVLVKHIVETALLYGRSNQCDPETEGLLVHVHSKVNCHIGNKSQLRYWPALDYLNSHVDKLNEIRARIGAGSIDKFTHL